ncbi:hypothetical protein ElyMa_001658700 [Elysia marginata]|uniref:Uncharacterized protein n=1 Tax=Elysia marginata TaxID=1093978 RepID=A0AAV4JN64_9GAST|nr:hypothetical protein ElyMa_001658700 [Elysia marginata]
MQNTSHTAATAITLLFATVTEQLLLLGPTLKQKSKELLSSYPTIHDTLDPWNSLREPAYSFARQRLQETEQVGRLRSTTTTTTTTTTTATATTVTTTTTTTTTTTPVSTTLNAQFQQNKK